MNMTKRNAVIALAAVICLGFVMVLLSIVGGWFSGGGHGGERRRSLPHRRRHLMPFRLGRRFPWRRCRA